ncbi:Xaa-Pro peptidase family protein [Carboxydocella sp. ULO1]|uniref:M24 family metallopeptidase n=1 Tax=Carboxydocella sp. ULO1 TaxID=1926599 RepID=UPI0009AE9699|nr:Xaa-Pro peptidase family protein [Carboxydocella sp. ULO1]GAW28869.1 peptidase M24 [Carboxydocella sp. ULO1]
MKIFYERIKKAQNLLEKNQLEAVIATSPPNFFYFTGTWMDSFERLQAVVIPKKGRPVIIIPEMSREDLKHLDDVETIFWDDGENAIKILARKLPERGTISIDNKWASENLIDLISITDNRLSFVKSTDVIGNLRMIKDEIEISLLRKSGSIADKVMARAIEYAKPGITEIDLVREIKRFFSEEGVHNLSFEPIVAKGKNGAIPHHQSNNSVIAEGDMVVIDLGGVKDYYCSDMTRTIVVGQPNQEMKEVYEIVKEAQEKAVNAIKPGMPMSYVDEVARSVINEAGYGPNFTHRTGHGIGIEVHEAPYLTSSNREQLLQEGMVVSVEPGIYLEGKFGVRIEDIVVVTANGAERLNNIPRSLIAAGEKVL